MSSIVGILLAAGSASRFGGDKLLAALADGNPIGAVSFRNLRTALQDVRVVVRAEDPALRALFERDSATVVECPDAHLGMSRSLVAGVRAAHLVSGRMLDFIEFDDGFAGVGRAPVDDTGRPDPILHMRRETPPHEGAGEP